MVLKRMFVLAWLFCFSVVSAEGLSYSVNEGKLQGPDTLAALGYAELSFQNNTDYALSLAVDRFKENKTPEDYKAALAGLRNAFATGGDVATAFQTFYGTMDSVGGVATKPQSIAHAGLMLEPGTYMVSSNCDDCPYEQDLLVLSVTDGARTEAPAAAVQLKMADFSFLGLPPELDHGDHVWELSNTGQQAHEVVVFKLATGKTPEDLQAYLAQPDNPVPPPAEFGSDVAKSALLGAGQRYFQSFSFEPGHYVLLCPVPDPATGTPHFHLGMIQALTVK